MVPVEMIRKFQALNVWDVINRTIKATEEQLLDENRHQLELGVRADDSKISPPYTFLTKRAKMKKGFSLAELENVMLYDTGRMYDSLHVDVYPGMMEIDSDVEYSGDLKEKYGEEIYGLSGDSRKNYVKEAFPVLVEKMKDALDLRG